MFITSSVKEKEGARAYSILGQKQGRNFILFKHKLSCPVNYVN